MQDGRPHRSSEESLDVIRNVLNGRECYAICEKGNPKAIGAIELILNRHNDTENHDEECELGYWLGKPFWGRGYMPEAEGLGIGSMLVAVLKNEILKRGKLPFYGTSMSHIASQRVALGAGFVPMWAELYCKSCK